MKRLFIILALILFMTGTAFSKPKDYFSLDAEVQFKLDDSDINGGRYYVGFQLEGELEAKLRFNDRLYATLAVEIDRKDVDPKEAIATLQEETQAIVPDYTVYITRDVDISD